MIKLLSAGAAVALATAAVPAAAATTVYVANPTGNSVDFANAVQARGTLVTNATFDTTTTGATIAATGDVTNANNAGPGQGNTFFGPLSMGEGLNPASAYLRVGAGSVLVDFLAPVFAAGLTTIDLFNPQAVNRVTLSAYTGTGGTGTLIGTATAADFNFQSNNRYFLGLSSDTANIRSFLFTSNGGGGDVIGVDNIVSGVAAVPEPATWAMMIGGFGMVGGALRRRSRHAGAAVPALA